jgi:hypothetical protein
MNDYNVQRATSTDVVDIVWFGHPGDSPHDVHTHQFIMKWHTDTALSKLARLVAMEDKWTVLRWEYFCCSVCSVITERN